MSTEHWHDVLETNLSSAFYVIRAALAHMNDDARIVLISSMAAHTGGSGGAGAYAAAKAGMIGLTRALAKELAPRGIAVNAIAPGLILGTPFHEQFTPPAAQEATIARLPVGRAGRPADVASLVTYLASEAYRLPHRRGHQPERWPGAGVSDASRRRERSDDLRGVEAAMARESNRTEE